MEEEASQKWYFTKINYRKGDINEDGVIDAYDYHLLESNINKLKAFSQSQKYLADMNEDGILNDSDIEVLDNYFKENDN